MKKIIWLGLILNSLIWVAVACSNNTTTSSPVTSSPTATPTSVPGVTIGQVVTYGGSFNYSPSTATITHGQAVVWDSSLNGHTVTLDNFSGTTGTCSPSLNANSFPVTQVFPTAGTYYYHCSISGHSGCNSTQCGICTGGNGMVGSVVVN